MSCILFYQWLFDVVWGSLGWFVVIRWTPISVVSMTPLFKGGNVLWRHRSNVDVFRRRSSTGYTDCFESYKSFIDINGCQYFICNEISIFLYVGKVPNTETFIPTTAVRMMWVGNLLFWNWSFRKKNLMFSFGFCCPFFFLSFLTFFLLFLVLSFFSFLVFCWETFFF